jgi:hypothetical protein
MANHSFLIATSSKQAFPRLRKPRPIVEVVACGNWGVPFLWFAMFRPEDMVTWKGHHLDGLPANLAAPIASRRKIPQRLEEAIGSLERAAPKAKTWDVHLRLLGDAIKSLEGKWKYVTCEWEEVLAHNPQGFYDSTDWLLRFFAGQRVQKASRAISEISGMKFDRPLRDPRADRAKPWSDNDEKQLGRLLGNEWKRSVPWWPKPGKPEGKSPDWRKLIEKGDLGAVKRALPPGASPPKHGVAAAAQASPQILEYFLSRGGDPNDVSTLFGSALLVAFNKGRQHTSRMVRMLLDAGADVNFTGLEGDNPYVLYACLGHGMEFARPVLARANKKSLKWFVNDLSTEEGRQSFEEDGPAPWIDEFVSLAKRELAKRS